MPAPHGACMKNTQTEKPGKNRPRQGHGGHHALPERRCGQQLHRRGKNTDFPLPRRVQESPRQRPGTGISPPGPFQTRRKDRGGLMMACQGHLQAVTQASAVPGRLSRQGTPDNLGIHISPHHPRNFKTSSVTHHRLSDTTNSATRASHHARALTGRQLHRRGYLSISHAHATCKSHPDNAQEWGSVPVARP